MTTNTLWNYGNLNRISGTITLLTSEDNEPVVVKVPENFQEITTLKSALAYIFAKTNHQRIDNHPDNSGVYHKYTFITNVIYYPTAYYFDTKAQVILWAKRLMAEKFMYGLIKEFYPEGAPLLAAALDAENKYHLRWWILHMREHMNKETNTILYSLYQ
jgi:hypothetical protein